MGCKVKRKMRAEQPELNLGARKKARKPVDILLMLLLHDVTRFWYPDLID